MDIGRKIADELWAVAEGKSALTELEMKELVTSYHQQQQKTKLFIKITDTDSEDAEGVTYVPIDKITYATFSAEEGLVIFMVDEIAHEVNHSSKVLALLDSLSIDCIAPVNPFELWKEEEFNG